MKIIEAVWEQRNLGVTCAEIEISASDTSNAVRNAVLSRHEQYLVAKVSPANTEVMFALQNMGFTYIETLFEVVYRIGKEKPMPEICRPFADDVGYHIADKAETERILEFVASGSLFSTDRIALDPYFSRKAAGQRYAYWMQDVLFSGKAVLLLCDYCGKSIGFTVAADKGSFLDMILGGAFPDTIGSGLGVVNAYCGLLYTYETGKKKVVSHVSSNNFQMFKIDIQLGNQVRTLTNNFILHQKTGT
jgi:hypothetical protein